MNALESHNDMFPKSEKASADYFTGTAWVHILVPRDETGNYAIDNVVFEPGSRNHWHKHPAGQIPLITDRKGYYQERGKPARLLTKGDIVVIPFRVERRHGAAHASNLTHIVVTNNSKEGAVEWLAPVEASGLQYTILRPTWFTNADEVDYEITRKGEPEKGSVISQKSLATFIASITKSPEKYIRENLGANKPHS